MPNPIKYTAGTETLALRDGNFWWGTGDVDKGPTSSTGYYNGISPPSGGYTIYQDKVSGGPSIYVANNDSELIRFTKDITNTTYPSATACLNYFRTQTDKMVFNIDYENIVTNGLLLNLDAGFRASYTSSGTSWYDLAASARTTTLINGPTYSSSNGGTIVFDGTNDYCEVNSTINTNYITIGAWVKANAATFGFIVNRTFNSSVVPYSLNVGGNASASNINGMAFYSGGSWRNSGISTDIRGDGSWHYVTGTFDGTTLAYYIDGTLNSSSLEGSGLTLPTNTSVVNIGRYQSDGNYFGGNIAIVQIYNRALNVVEITQNFNAQKARFGL